MLPNWIIGGTACPSMPHRPGREVSADRMFLMGNTSTTAATTVVLGVGLKANSDAGLRPVRAIPLEDEKRDLTSNS